MAHGLKMGVVAEGVETEEQRELLHQMGCGQAQGYLLSRPISLEKIIGLIKLQNMPAQAALRLIK